MVVKEGHTYWIPANSSEGTSISGYGRWEQAFKVFSEIYMKVHPYRASELVQYNHLIHLASQTYIWENVYLYDKDFRIHMSKYPKRSWSIILQQAWTVRLHDKVKAHSGNEKLSHSKNEICKMFNKMRRCSYGAQCKFEHRCSYCFKIGHGIFNCRNWKADHAESGRYDRSDRKRRHSYGHQERHRRSRLRSWSRDRYNGNSNKNNNNNSDGGRKVQAKAK